MTSAGRTASGRIRPRRVTFDWTDVPLHWLGGNAYTTHMMNSLQLLLPGR